MNAREWLVDELIEFEKLYNNRFDWDAQHTVWMLDLETKEWVLLSTKVDPDELISYAVSASVYSQTVMVLHGWAAPNDDADVAPSEHAERRRLRLFIHIESGEVTYAHKFIDGQLEILDSPFSGRFMSLIEEAIEYTREYHPSLPETFLA